MAPAPPFSKHHSLVRLCAAGLGFSLLALLSYVCAPKAVHRLRAAAEPVRAKLDFLRPFAPSVEPLPGSGAEPLAARGWTVPLPKRLLQRRQASSGATTSIPITDSLPSTLTLPHSLVESYDALFTSLSSLAQSLTKDAISASHLTISGVPGTAISSDEEARALQEYLDCTSGHGEWVYDPQGEELRRRGGSLTVHKMEGRFAACEKRFYKGREPGEDVTPETWDVRSSLKWRWSPSSSCSSLLPPSYSSHSPPHLSRVRLCQLLAHKSTLLLGDTPQYSLHDLLLDWTTTEPQSCYGDLYCKEHALCGEILRAKDQGAVENWEADSRVYHRLPFPPGSSSSSLSPRNLSDSSLSSVDKRQQFMRHPSPSYGTLLRYRRTDGLRPATAQTLPTYTHPSTAIREINQQWLADARRSDVVVLSKPPLPLPLEGHNSTWDAWVYSYLREEESLEKKAQRMLEAAADITAHVWLPELFEALRAIRTSPSPGDQLVVYRSGWRSHEGCAAAFSSGSDDEDSDVPTSPGDGPPPLRSQPSLSHLLFRSSPAPSSTDPQELADLPTLFHNLQLLLQNHLARALVLPSFGVPYLDLETPLSVWRGGMVGSSAAPPWVASASSAGQTAFSSRPPKGAGMRTPASGDCARYCFPSPGMAVEEFFIGGLMRVFEAGWAGSKEAEEVWMGDGEGFRNLRERIADREGRAR
ncbi:hypothetical protein JCM21900_006627 [Sporobolomyces salmonicolor]